MDGNILVRDRLSTGADHSLVKPAEGGIQLRGTAAFVSDRARALLPTSWAEPTDQRPVSRKEDEARPTVSASDSYLRALQEYATGLSMLRRARIWQIRVVSVGLDRMARRRTGRGLLRAIRAWGPSAALLRAALGYRGTFATLEQARQAVARYANGGHVHPANASFHLDTVERPRPSDYAALFHIRPLLPDLRRVFDLGGNVGNLFYLYARHMSFRDDVQWWINDLPEHLDQGAEIARRYNALQLRFTPRFADADGADLLIASGSLHYFPIPLSQMISSLRHPPRHVLINRAPLTNGPSAATVQDAGAFRVACMLYNRQELIDGFVAAGYEMVDSWPATELALTVPGHTEHRVEAYSGFMFRRHARVQA